MKTMRKPALLAGALLLALGSTTALTIRGFSCLARRRPATNAIISRRL